MPFYLDTETWSRRAQFEFFRDYANPFFNICAAVDITPLLAFARGAEGVSLSIAYHFLSLKAAHEVEPFRYRLRGRRVLVHERLRAGTVVLRDDESFAFAHFDYDEDFPAFHARARAVVERAKAVASRLDDDADRDDLIYHSVLPWFSFTSISHARRGGGQESVPKIAFGRYQEEGGRVRMPVAVEVHHALMDGLHVGRYFERLQGFCSDPRPALG